MIFKVFDSKRNEFIKEFDGETFLIDTNGVLYISDKYSQTEYCEKDLVAVFSLDGKEFKKPNKTIKHAHDKRGWQPK